MKRLLLVVLLISLSAVAFAQQTEDITLTTYYPAPHGEYATLSSDLLVSPGVATVAEPPVSLADEGRIYYNSDDDTFMISENGGDYQSIGSIASGASSWSMSGSTLHLRDEDTNLGLGTDNANNAIHVKGADADISLEIAPAGSTESAKVSFRQEGTADSDGDGTLDSLQNGYIGFMPSTNRMVIANTSGGTTQKLILEDDGALKVGTENYATTIVNSNGFKTFVINHPIDESRYLVHASIEGPEGAVYYRGEERLSAGEALVTLPDYFEPLTRKEGRTIQLTAKGQKPFLLSYTGIEDGQFKVYGTDPDGEFSWEVKAVRNDIPVINVEPDKNDVKVRGFGPYTYIE
ncbi:MAG: hypothetical protein HQ572_01485 [Candidatus Omnitrophica bacterium]|nr:hypothetical protein [Candidatus Omnitrophota bacterium]